MYLKAIKLSGFKSFTEPTEIILEPGITAIVGPNGSGKSNIVDAIRWCLGELSAKTLRSKALAEVIFNGTRRLPPAQSAQVTLVFDNENRALHLDASEIAVTRKIERQAVSEYAINRSPCRLKDIKELFLGTGIGEDGYSIMEGSTVEFLLTAKPHERRLLFDEASGGARFMAKRDEALSKLSKTQNDLDRINDQIELLSLEQRRLESQARKARLYGKLSEEKKILESRKIINELERLKTQIEHLQNETLDPKNQELNAKSVALNQLYAQSEGLQAEKIELDKELAAKTQDFHEALSRRNVALEKLRNLDEKIAEKDAAGQTMTQEREQSLKQLEWHEQNLQEIQEVLELKQTELEAKKTALDQEAQKRPRPEDTAPGAPEGLSRPQTEKNPQETGFDREDMEAEAGRLKNAIFETTQKMENLKTEAIALLSENSEIQAELRISLKEHHRVGMEKLHLDESVRDLEKKEKAIDAQLETLKQEKENFAGKEKDLGRLKQTKEEEIFRVLPKEETQLAAQLAHWETTNGQDPYVRGLKSIEEALENFNGVTGPIGSLIRCAQQHERLVAELLGERRRWFIAENMEAAQKALDHLAQNQGGRAAFVLADRVNENPAPASLNWNIEMPGSSGKILEFNDLLGDTDVRTKKVAAYLVGPTYVQGESSYGEAIIYGGETLNNANTPIVLVDLRQYQEMRRRLEEIQGRRAVLEKELEDIDSQIQTLHEQTQTLNSAIEQKTVARVETVKTKEASTKELHFAHETARALEKESQEKLAILSTKKERHEEAEKEIRAFDERLSGLRAKLEAKEFYLNNALLIEKARREQELTRELALQEISREMALYEERQSQSIKSMAAAKIQSSKLAQAADALENELKTLKAEQEQTQKDLQALEEERRDSGRRLEELQGHGQKQMQTLTELKEQQNALEEETRRLEADLREEEMELKTLQYEQRRTIEEAFHVFNLNTEAALTAKIQEINEARQKGKEKEGENEIPDQDLTGHLQRINERLEKLGQINFLAGEQFNEIESRLTELQIQRDDILKAKEDIHQAIAKIKTQIEESFGATFAAVREKFREIFGQLFEGGGEADLALVTNEQTGEQGVEIYAQPPGKKLQTITQLSQGEKALTIVSLLFAFFAIKPSPVCVLDEIDAPLDEANVERFTRMLKKFSESCQFVMITHNKKTMAAARALYGVTMEELGVSKIISVRLEDVAVPV